MFAMKNVKQTLLTVEGSIVLYYGYSV